MVIPRKKRTSLFRQQVEKEWSEYYRRFVLKYSDKLNWELISCNPNISMDIIEKYPDNPWDWNSISYNPNITMDIIEKYPDKPWNWNAISCNPNITMSFIEKNLDKRWNWYWISRNPFNYEKELFIEKRMRKYLAAYKIQQYYWKSVCNPHCQIGYNKVNRDYDKLFTEDGRIKRIKLN